MSGTQCSTKNNYDLDNGSSEDNLKACVYIKSSNTNFFYRNVQNSMSTKQ